MFPCTSLVYSLDALCSFLIYILFFTDKKKKKKIYIYIYIYIYIWDLNLEPPIT